MPDFPPSLDSDYPDFGLSEDLRKARGGIDSFEWVLNNIHQAGTPLWDNMLRAARKDADEARSALERIEGRFRTMPR